MVSYKRHLVSALVLAWLGTMVPPAAASSGVTPSHTARGHRDQDAQALANYVAHVLTIQARTEHRGTLRIRVEPPKTKGLASCDTWHAVKPKSLRSHTSIQVRCLAPRPWALYVQAHLTLPGVYYTAARTLVPGETVGPDDLRAVRADLLHLPADTVTQATQAVGRVTTQRIRKGGTLKSGVLRDAQSIQRGQRVHTEARGPGFSMRGAGLALQSGTPGSLIQVRTASGAVVSAIVVDATTVQVPL